MYYYYYRTRQELLGYLAILAAVALTATILATLGYRRARARLKHELLDATDFISSGDLAEAFQKIARILQTPAAIRKAAAPNGNIYAPGYDADAPLKLAIHTLSVQSAATRKLAELYKNSRQENGITLSNELVKLLHQQSSVVANKRLNSWVTGSRNKELVRIFEECEKRKQEIARLLPPIENA